MVLSEYSRDLANSFLRNTAAPSFVQLTERCYLFVPKDEQEEPFSTAYLTFDIFSRLLNGDGEAFVCFGTLKRTYANGGARRQFSIVPSLCKRAIQRKPFWERTSRFFSDDCHPISYPEGYAITTE